MSTVQSAAERPEPTPQRKAAIAHAGGFDHASVARVSPIRDFDLNRTIFKTLEGGLQRFVMATRVGKDVQFDAAAAQEIDAAYRAALDANPLPPVDPDLLQFLVRECDFDVEHADGSFLDHLYFCFEYSAQHYPDHSPRIMLLHSILGTGTNTFAMGAEKIPALREHLTDAEWTHIEAFPSMLRLLYDLPLRQELRSKLGRWDTLQSITLRRVIDNAPIELSADAFFAQLNFNLMHLLDFLPVSNWAAHQGVPSFIVFRDLHALMESADKRAFPLHYKQADGPRGLTNEDTSFAGWLTTRVPVGVQERMAAKSVRRFSERAGHDIGYTIDWG